MCRRCGIREVISGFELCLVCPNEEAAEIHERFLNSLSAKHLKHLDVYSKAVSISLAIKIIEEKRLKNISTKNTC